MLGLRKRFFVALSLTVLLLVGLAGSAAAIEVRGGGDTMTIAANEVIDDDLVLSAGNVVMNGTINGNLFVSGGQIEINGIVNGSVFYVGQNIAINGKVNGSMFGAGAAVTLRPQAMVERNFSFAGYHLKSEAGNVVGRDLSFAGYQALLFGEVKRDVLFAGGALELNGKVGRNVNAEVGEPGTADTPPMQYFVSGMPAAVNAGLRVSKEASIGGALNYRSQADQANAILAAPAGGVTHQLPPVTATRVPVTPTPQALVFNWFVAQLREFATLLVLGLLAVWLAPKAMHKAVEQAHASPLEAGGWGFLVLIAGYILAFIAFLMVLSIGIFFGAITLGGLAGTVFSVGFSALSLAFTLFTLLVSYGSKLVVAYLIGQLVLQTFAKPYAEHRVWPLLVGIILYVLVASIPILGWLIGFVVMVVGLGAIWFAYRKRPLPTPAPMQTPMPKPV